MTIQMKRVLLIKNVGEPKMSSLDPLNMHFLCICLCGSVVHGCNCPIVLAFADKMKLENLEKDENRECCKLHATLTLDGLNSVIVAQSSRTAKNSKPTRCVR